MKPRDPRVSILDAITAGETIEGFLVGRSFEEYSADRLLASGVERQFEILGEALARALRADASLADYLPDAVDVIGFRNVLAHGYDAVSDVLVWSIAQEKLPALLERLRTTLANISCDTGPDEGNRDPL